MLDALIRPRLVPVLDQMATKISQSGLPANNITIIGFFLGFTGCFLVGMQMYLPGLLLLLIALTFFGLDGAVARATQVTELGIFLNMMSGVILFAVFPFFFMMSAPNHAFAACTLLLSYLLMGMANLAYDFFAMKKGAEPAKSGLVENGEIIAFMILCCLFPAYFSGFAAFLAIASFVAAFMRMGFTIKLLKA